MSPDQYWEGDPFLAKAYRKAHEKQIEQRNQELWLQGLYVFDAVSSALFNVNKKKTQPARHYIEKPIDLFKKETDKNVELERRKVIDNLQALREAWIRKNKKEEADGNRTRRT